MNDDRIGKISEAFKNSDNGKAFIGFLTGGDPTIGNTKEFIKTMISAGVDIVEIGIPFSDPIAEGPVIQEANNRALSVGTTVDDLFDMISELRNEGVEIPLLFMTYLNPVYHYGYDEFFKRAKLAGLDGIIIPDLPYEEQDEVKNIATIYNVDVISLIAPTSSDRIIMIAKEAEGFIYLVSSMGVTGERNEIDTDISTITKMIKSVTKVPIAVGFGISTLEQAKQMAGIADGAIVGSAIVHIIAKYGRLSAPHIYELVKDMKNAINSL